MNLNVILLILILLGVIILGGGLGLILYYRMRPKPETWTAYVYGVGEGVKEIETDKDGNLVGKLKLKDLIPYKKDLLVKIRKDHGITVYKLSSLNYTTQQPPPDAVDVWGNNERVVNVLVVGNNATILRQGYDTELGERIFRPMPRELLEMVISEAEIKTNELDDTKTLLQQALPWMGVIIIGLVMVAVSYFMGQGMIEGSKHFEAGQKYAGDRGKEAAEIYRDGVKAVSSVVNLPETENNIYGKQPSNKTKELETIK